MIVTSAKVLTLGAPSVFGFVAGWLAGNGGPDAAALILPSLLSLAGIALNYVSNDRSSVFIVFFAVFFFVGVKVGTLERAKDSARGFEEAYKAKIEFLRRCSQDEYLTNLGRKELDLEPLKTEKFCS